MLREWQLTWGISDLAMSDLIARLGQQGKEAMPDVEIDDTKQGSESRQQALIRIAAANAGLWLTRNNVGALLDARGVPVRYGLANESAAQNKAVKSGDLVGIQTVLIGPQHVGQLFGRFVSVECKEQKWVYSGKGREAQQKAWADFVVSKGGIGMFANSPEQFINQLRGQSA